VKYYRDGKPFRESAGTEKETEAKKFLQRREGQVVEGKFEGLKVEKVTFEDLKKDLLNDYELNARRSLDRTKLSLNHLDDAFKGMKAIHITTNQVERYILKRKQAGASNGTINRELSALRRMMSWGQGRRRRRSSVRPSSRSSRRRIRGRSSSSMRNTGG